MPPNTFAIAFSLSGVAAMSKAMGATVPGMRPVVAALTVVAIAVCAAER